MVQTFQSSLERLILPKSKILLAVSGGLDSVVMAHLFAKTDVKFAMAHCNFHLRGNESDGDELFVKTLAERLDVECFVKHFDTKKIKKTAKGSTQMLARELRYDWFEKILSENDFNHLATAHHLNDNLETSIYHFISGTGIRGLRGIPQTNDKIIRPLLGISRKELEAFANKNDISYREDSSNASDDYTRNRIRHHVIPALRQVQTDVEKRSQTTFQNLIQTEELLDYFMIEKYKEICLEKNALVFISKEKLREIPHYPTLLFEWFGKHGFSREQLLQIPSIMDGLSGKFLASETHKITNDRTNLILSPLVDSTQFFELNLGETIHFPEGKKITCEETNISFEMALTEMKNDVHICFLPKEKLKFPLKIRRWQEGDSFHPIGLKGNKKLKKYFSDIKLSVPEKEQVWILESQGDICWVVGLRMDERFRLGKTVTDVLRISMK